MRWVWLIALAACSFRTNGKASPDATGDSAMMMTGDASGCWGTGVVKICPGTAPAGMVTLTGDFDTGTSPDCKPYQVAPGALPLDACVVTARAITVSGTFTVTGPRPLVLLASDTITVQAGATLDVSSHREPARTGPGANATACNASGDGTPDFNGCGGGAGGSFGDTGGKGGDGDSGAAGGQAGAKAATVDILRGGCPGGGGGGTTGGTAGAGGGAVALLAGTSILVSGTINASGAAGDGAAGFSDGGGGAGSGGMIVLDAPTLFGGGTLIANGGGGGEGASNNPGSPGLEPDPTMPLSAAPGGSGNTNAGNGGDGAAGTTTTGQSGSDGTSNDGGGGGGGGAGYVVMYATANTLTGARSP